ncbi:hypothetical protein T440DRAFT_551058 [Plenodomus tracheiphilus IPT5]|uniref:AAA+ ATPase domain-containing protein n=1 Tax=Plenodomus tracheiphilus IPT5 TaxID=1408161 RepID=A0A6A7BK76_9PLEO|nr:hypothetical protein T440DRAFT_551058 [Plenodomus tracheiphilus IPT5]
MTSRPLTPSIVTDMEPLLNGHCDATKKGEFDSKSQDHESGSHKSFEAGSAVLGTSKDEDNTTRELLAQLKANTERLEALESKYEAVKEKLKTLVGEEESAQDGSAALSGEGNDDDAASVASDFDQDDVEEKSTDGKAAHLKFMESMKYVSSEEWLKSNLARTYKIAGDFPIPKDLSVVVSQREVNPKTIPVNEASPVDSQLRTAANGIALRPDRVAITCPVLLTEIGRISGASTSERNNVLLRPFKNIIPFRTEIEQSLQTNQTIATELQEAKKKRRAEYDEACLKAEASGSTAPAKEGKNLETDDRAKLKKAEKLSVGLRCLLHFIDYDAADIMEIRRETKNAEYEIAFEHLWHIFEPGMLVCPRGDKELAYRVLNVGGGRTYGENMDHNGQPLGGSRITKMTDFFVDCFHIDFNGTHYVPVPIYLSISPYEGKRSLRSLIVAPLECLHSKEEVQKLKDRLVTRGKRFEKLAEVTHQRYSGLSLQDKTSRCEEIDGDVIIDFALAFKNNELDVMDRPEKSIWPDVSFKRPGPPGLIVLELTTPDTRETQEPYKGCSVQDCTTCETNTVHDDIGYELLRRSNFLSDHPKLLKETEKRLGDDRYMLLPYRMYGYVLLSRKWYPLDIDLLEDIVESKSQSDGFDDLVLPEDHKEIVRALVKTHARGPRSTSDKEAKATRQMDLVKGKGKGLIILLHGVPGVGKTSTAECVAAHTNRPLFPITCGDIGGQTPREVETNLESYFDLARKWGCVLLLDEADVFLGERTKGDILQNSLVSVFLRVLEYYSGILILTTNRVGQFDEAIKSRIHISLYYPPLDRKRTLQIWRMNLRRLKDENDAKAMQGSKSQLARKSTLPVIEFEHNEIMDFAKGHWKVCQQNKSNWNGRQIKNAFQTAIALAEWDTMTLQKRRKIKETMPVVLTKDNFKKVAEASAKFDEYLVSVRRSDATNAAEKRNRKDEFQDKGKSSEYGIVYPTLEERRLQRKKSSRAQAQYDDDEDEDEDDDGDGDGDEDVDDSDDSSEEEESVPVEKIQKPTKKAKKSQPTQTEVPAKAGKKSRNGVSSKKTGGGRKETEETRAKEPSSEDDSEDETDN